MSYKGSKETLRFRLSAYIAIAIMVTGAVAGGGFLVLLKRDREVVLKEHLKWMASAAAFLVEDEFKEAEIEEVEEVIKSFELAERILHEEDPFELMEFLEVIDPEGNSVAELQVGLSDDEKAFAEGLRSKAVAVVEPYFWERSSDGDCAIVGLIYPVYSGGERIGTLNVAICDEPIRRVMGEYARFVGLFLLFSGIIGLIVGGRLALWVSGPIRRLAEGAAELAGGKFGYRVDVSGPEEVRSLAGSFNSMAASLEQRVDELVDAREKAESLSDKLADSLNRAKKAAESLEVAHRKATEVSGKLEAVNSELFAEKSQTETIVHSIRDGIIAIDVNEKVILMNPEAEELFGESEDEARGKPVGLLVEKLLKKVEDPKSLREAFMKSVAEPELESDLTVTVLSPARKVYKRRSSAIKDEKGVMAGRVVTFSDVTREQEIDSMKSNFVSTVSHELRTPLTSIKGALTLLMDGQVSDDATRREFLQIAEYNTDRLISLITNLLDLSRIDAGAVSLNVTRLDLPELISGFLGKTPFMSGRDDVRLVATYPEEPVQVLGDKDKLEQVVANLLSNAYKFSPGGGRVKLEVTCGQDDVTVSVEDEGPGIPPDKLDRVFDRFYQVDMSATRKFGGTGLGLSICKAIVREHGGKVRAESPLADGRGARFVVQLPRAKHVQLELGFGSERRAGKDTAGQATSVLVAEAEPDAARAHREALEAEGFRVVEAHNGKDALRIVREEHPVLVFMDVELPGMQGYEVAEAIQADESTSGIPIVFTSDEGRGLEPGEVVRRCGYIQKPFEGGKLVEKVRECLGQS